MHPRAITVAHYASSRQQRLHLVAATYPMQLIAGLLPSSIAAEEMGQDIWPIKFFKASSPRMGHNLPHQSADFTPAHRLESSRNHHNEHCILLPTTQRHHPNEAYSRRLQGSSSQRPATPATEMASPIPCTRPTASPARPLHAQAHLGYKKQQRGSSSGSLLFFSLSLGPSSFFLRHHLPTLHPSRVSLSVDNGRRT